MRQLVSKLLFRAGLGKAAPRAAAPRWTPRPPRSANDAAKADEPALVILDKDGTIFEFEAMWGQWLSSNVQRVVAQLQPRDSAQSSGARGAAAEAAAGAWKAALNHALAGCETGKVHGHSPMAHFAMDSLRSTAVETLSSKEVLGSFAVSEEAARMAVEAGWCDELNAEDAPAIPVQGATRWISDMSDHGAIISVCTSDSRKNAEQGLQASGLRPLVRAMLCGDDQEYKPKPNHDNVQVLQRRLGILDRNRVTVIGDSPLDVGMGAGANVLASVGVCSGVGSLKELQAAATVANETSKTRASVIDRLAVAYVAPDHAAPTTDVLIIGAGSAGCTLAARLAERHPEMNFTLVEAGGPDRGRLDSWHVHMPAALTHNIGHPGHDWMYQTEPLPHLNNRRLAWPRGKILGGSSSLNAMVYVRGHPLDYERWEREGAAGWGWNQVLPYFRRAENYSHIDQTNAAFHGDSGPLRVSRADARDPLAQAFLQAGAQAGFPVAPEMNGATCGAALAPMDFTISGGKRWSAAEAYLGSEAGIPLPNLRVETGAHAHKLLFAGDRVIGADLALHGKAKPPTKVFASRVILCGGAINSPQLLQLSGIGDPATLQQAGVRTRIELPGVGHNLQDHMEVYVQHFCKQPLTLYSAQWKFPHNMVQIGLEWFTSGKGKGGTNHMEAGGFVQTPVAAANNEHANAQFHFFPGMLAEQSSWDKRGHGFQLHVGPMCVPASSK
eukprot:INCI1068.2.p1 GENE.INCI1068.2~~INCI1068.2.p1  ORF type:complete len:725 (-),score=86.42 INCI1068.2:102-2276(-)